MNMLWTVCCQYVTCKIQICLISCQLVKYVTWGCCCSLISWALKKTAAHHQIQRTDIARQKFASAEAGALYRSEPVWQDAGTHSSKILLWQPEYRSDQMLQVPWKATTKGTEINFLYALVLHNNLFPTLLETRTSIHESKCFPLVSDVGGQHSCLLFLTSFVPDYTTGHFGVYLEPYFTGGHSS